jgi:hypothetical protein
MENTAVRFVTARFAGPVTLALAALFTGAALYILVAEQPARLSLDAPALLRQWQASIGPATRMQASLVVLTAAGGLLSWRATGSRLWLFGIFAIAANLPLTLIAIAPINSALQALPLDQAGTASRALIARWGELHSIRAGLGVLATGLFAWALAQRS